MATSATIPPIAPPSTPQQTPTSPPDKPEPKTYTQPSPMSDSRATSPPGTSPPQQKTPPFEWKTMTLNQKRKWTQKNNAPTQSLPDPQPELPRHHQPLLPNSLKPLLLVRSPVQSRSHPTGTQCLVNRKTIGIADIFEGRGQWHIARTNF